MAVSLTALFVALGGTSYAAIKLPANSVGSREIKQRSVQTSDLALNARLSKTNKVFRAAVTDTLLDPNTQAVVDALGAAVKGEKGDKGDAGSAGPVGATGIPGVSGYVIRDAYSADGAPHTTVGTVAKCLTGERVISGGARWEPSPSLDGLPIADYPEDDANGSAWAAIYYNQSASDTGRVHVFAVCAKAN